MLKFSRSVTTFLLASTALATGAQAQTTGTAEPIDVTPATTGANTGTVQAGQEIIVTGSRAVGMQAADAAAPVTVLGADTIARVGQPNLNQALTQLVPSFTAQTQGTDMSNFSLSARLRGLSPNHTLVMVNGKRRHNSAILQVISGAFQGSAAPSIDLIPPDAVQRVEILQEGAAAQYGSDAIAGVVNIILKSNSSGGTAKASYGQYYDGEGDQYSASGNVGVPLGDAGFASLTLFHRRSGHTYSGEGQLSATDPTGAAYPGLTGPAAEWADLDLSEINGGQAKSTLSIGFINAGYEFDSGVELYAFGNVAERVGYANQGYRHPARICSSSTIGASGGSGTYDPATCFADTGLAGMVPQQNVREFEYSITGGLRGQAGELDWDLSTTYGFVEDDVYTINSANRQLFLDTGFSPRDFYAGSFRSDQLTTTLDLRYGLDVAGFADVLTLAAGAEYREDGYAIMAGDPLSYYGDGAQSFPGYKPTDAGDYSRHSFAGYVNVIAVPVDGWTIDLAGRFEDYSAFGSTTIGKITTRYDFSDALALRGTASTGFRAPTLAESYYSAANVAPTSVTAQLPPNSAAAAALGFAPLGPEKSTNFSLGTVLRPVDRLAVTIDAYWIEIEDRITGTSSIRGLVSGVEQTTPTINGQTAYQAVLAALQAQGIATAGLPNLAAATFTNGIDTRTRGVDFSARYPVDLAFGDLDLTLTATYADTKITDNRVPFGLFDVVSESVIERAQPKFRTVLSAVFNSGPFSASLRQSYQTRAVVLTRPSISGFGPYEAVVKATPLTDLEFSYDLTEWVRLSVGANNLFDKMPEKPALLPDEALARVTPGVSPWINGSTTIGSRFGHGTYGSNGGFYYARLSFNF